MPQHHLLLTDSSPSHCLTVSVILLPVFVHCVRPHILQNRKNFRMTSALNNDDACLPIPDKTLHPPPLRIYLMPVSHRRFLTSTRLSRQCRPNACDLFHVKDVTTKPHCHATDLPRSSERQSYAYTILPPPQPHVMAVPLYYISLITDAPQYIINKETNVSTLLQLKIQKSNKHNVENKKSDRANAQPQKIIMIKQCRQMQ